MEPKSSFFDKFFEDSMEGEDAEEAIFRMNKDSISAKELIVQD